MMQQVSIVPDKTEQCGGAPGKGTAGRALMLLLGCAVSLPRGFASHLLALEALASTGGP